MTSKSKSENTVKQAKGMLHHNSVGILLAVIFIIIYVANSCAGNNSVYNALTGSGFKRLDGQIYRIITGSFLHGSILHIVSNILALLCVCSVIQKRMGFWKTLILYLGCDLIASIMFYGYMNECSGGNGSSIAIFALFAIVLVLWLRYPEKFHFKRYNPALIYVLIYFVIANLISGNYTTILIHAFSFFTGLIAGIIIIQTNQIND